MTNKIRFRHFNCGNFRWNAYIRKTIDEKRKLYLKKMSNSMERIVGLTEFSRAIRRNRTKNKSECTLNGYGDK